MTYIVSSGALNSTHSLASSKDVLHKWRSTFSVCSPASRICGETRQNTRYVGRCECYHLTISGLSSSKIMDAGD